MTAEAILTIAFYGTLAGVAMWATWRDDCLFWVGFWLVAGFLISNAAHFATEPVNLPGIYTAIEVLVMVAAYLAWGNCRMAALILIVVANTISICANVAFAAIISPTLRQINVWEVTTNVCFAAECLFATLAGISNGRRVGRFHRWPLAGRRVAESHATRAEGD